MAVTSFVSRSNSAVLSLMRNHEFEREKAEEIVRSFFAQESERTGLALDSARVEVEKSETLDNLVERIEQYLTTHPETIRSYEQKKALQQLMRLAPDLPELAEEASRMQAGLATRRDLWQSFFTLLGSVIERNDPTFRARYLKALDGLKEEMMAGRKIGLRIGFREADKQQLETVLTEMPEELKEVYESIIAGVKEKFDQLCSPWQVDLFRNCFLEFNHQKLIEDMISLAKQMQSKFQVEFSSQEISQEIEEVLTVKEEHLKSTQGSFQQLMVLLKQGAQAETILPQVEQFAHAFLSFLECRGPFWEKIKNFVRDQDQVAAKSFKKFVSGNEYREECGEGSSLLTTLKRKRISLAEVMENNLESQSRRICSRGLAT